ncbi:MAG: peptidoglycan editing factor PgeF [Deltaproteobacteria bacterium]|nr:peptidoglycan editing factor PgeF [Myxococcales bacterium]MDP3218269.1 peptidoglycan editing factor PgeF [Deltaproteobacteria bacterium]
MSDEAVLRARRFTEAGIRHGFSTRLGGVSAGPYAAMNLARNVGDDPAAVAENHRRFAAAVGYEPARLFESSQVHGARVLRTEGAAADATRAEEADALVTSTPGDAVAVRVADCVPVLLAAPGRGVVAAVHAGWRGVTQRVIAAAVEAMGVRGDELIAAVGPCIGPCCFEVGDEVAAEIAGASSEAVVARPGEGRPRVDLRAAVAAQLVGVGARAVEHVGGCTRCEGGRYHSYRRDGKASGRMLAAIVA